MLTLITSYPKSGNTWMRRFLCCYALGRKVHLSELPTVCPLIYSPAILSGLGIQPDLEKPIPFIDARPEMYRQYRKLCDESGKRLFLKTHSANVEVNGVPQNLNECIDKYVYLVRHPLDLIPSYANHMNISIAETWEKMKISSFMTRRDADSPCWELVSSWERHTRSWFELAQKEPKKIMIVRYENMKRQPITTFQKVLSHLEFSYDESLFAKCLHWSDFETMKTEEQAMEGGYRESTPCGNFFRKGEIGDGSKTVPQSIQDEVRTLFPDIMQTLGYE